MMTTWPFNPESPRHGRKHRFWISHWEPPKVRCDRRGYRVSRPSTNSTPNSHQTHTTLQSVSRRAKKPLIFFPPKNTSPSKVFGWFTDSPNIFGENLQLHIFQVFSKNRCSILQCLNHFFLGPCTEFSACTCKAAGSSSILSFATSARTQGCDETRKFSKAYCKCCLSLRRGLN